MSQEQLLSQLAELQRSHDALSQEVSALKTERDRLVGALHQYLPPPTESELAQARMQTGQLTRVLDDLAKEYGVVENGR